VIETAREELVVGEREAGHAVFVGIEFLNLLGLFDVPDANSLIVAPTEQVIIEYLEAVDPP